MKHTQDTGNHYYVVTAKGRWDITVLFGAFCETPEAAIEEAVKAGAPKETITGVYPMRMNNFLSPVEMNHG